MNGPVAENYKKKIIALGTPSELNPREEGENISLEISLPS